MASTSLSREDRGDDRPLARGSSRSSSQSTASGVCAPSRTSSGPRALEPARAARPRPRASIGWPRNASAASRAPPTTGSACSATRRAPLVVGQDDRRAGLDDGELLARDLLARVAEDVGVLETRRSSARRRARRATFVASSRPPRPASTTATSTPRSAKSASAAAVSASNCVAPPPRPPARTRATARSNDSGSVSRRSCQPLTCGDVYAPTSSPSRAQQRRDRARRRRLAVRADDVDRRERALRIAERVEERAHPVEPELLGPRRERSRPSQSPMCVELTPVALELLALGLDDLGGRVLRRSARSRASSRRARSRLRSRSRSASTLPFARWRSGFTTASKMRRSSPSSSTAARRCAGTSPPPPARASSASAVGSRRPARATARRSAASRARAGSTRSPRSRAASPDAAASAAARARRARSRARRRRRRRGAA